MKTAVILARVSTLTQDYDRQIYDLNEWATINNIKVVNTFSNKVSGIKSNIEREEIVQLISYVKKNKVDKVLVHSICRLGRNTLEALKVIEVLNKERICLSVKNYNIDTLDENGNINPMAQFLITILLEVGRMERDTIRQRMHSGYINHLKNGGSVGRKKGYQKSEETMKIEYKEEIKLLRKGLSLRNVYKITNTSINTLRKVKKIIS